VSPSKNISSRLLNEVIVVVVVVVVVVECYCFLIIFIVVVPQNCHSHFATKT